VVFDRSSRFFRDSRNGEPLEAAAVIVVVRIDIVGQAVAVVVAVEVACDGGVLGPAFKPAVRAQLEVNGGQGGVGERRGGRRERDDGAEGRQIAPWDGSGCFVHRIAQIVAAGLGRDLLAKIGFRIFAEGTGVDDRFIGEDAGIDPAASGRIRAKPKAVQDVSPSSILILFEKPRRMPDRP